MNLDSEDFPRLNANSSSSEPPGVNPRSVLGVNGGEDSVQGSDHSLGMNWLKGFTKPVDPRTSIKLAFNDTQMIDGATSAVFDSGELKTHISDCDSYVVGYFVGNRPSFPVVKDSLKSLWKTKGDFSMTIYGQLAFFFHFVLDEDRDRVLELGYVHVEGKLFLIRPWSPFLEQNIGALSSVPIWMNITGIPFHLWNDLGFSRIASIVGKPIMTDAQTALKTRMSYARICVEIDANCSYPSVLPFYIDNVKYEAKAEYPWKPKACSICKRFGHSSTKCSLNPTSVLKQVWVPKVQVTNDNFDASQVLSDLAIVNGVRSNPQGIDKFVGAKEVVSQVSALDPPSAIDGILQLAEKTSENSFQPAEPLWTYARKSKKSGKKIDKTMTLDTSLLNPFEVLFQDGEHREQGLMGGSKSDHLVNEEICESGAAKVSEVTIETEKVVQVQVDIIEEHGKDDQVELNVTESSMVESVESEEEGEKAKKLKPLEEVSKFKPMGKEENINKLMQLTGTFGVCREGRDSEVHNIFSCIADRSHSLKSKEAAKLSWEGVTDNEKLGRGMRTPIPAKKKM